MGQSQNESIESKADESELEKVQLPCNGAFALGPPFVQPNAGEWFDNTPALRMPTAMSLSQLEKRPSPSFRRLSSQQGCVKMRIQSLILRILIFGFYKTCSSIYQVGLLLIQKLLKSGLEVKTLSVASCRSSSIWRASATTRRKSHGCPGIPAIPNQTGFRAYGFLLACSCRFGRSLREPG